MCRYWAKTLWFLLSLSQHIMWAQLARDIASDLIWFSMEDFRILNFCIKRWLLTMLPLIPPFKYVAFVKVLFQFIFSSNIHRKHQLKKTWTINSQTFVRSFYKKSCTRDARAVSVSASCAKIKQTVVSFPLQQLRAQFATQLQKFNLG